MQKIEAVNEPLRLATGHRFEIIFDDWQDPTSQSERHRLMLEGLQHGILPPLGNGYEFVVDLCHGGHSDTDNLIPPVEFTHTYFADGKVPLSELGHPLRFHDESHVDGYMELFRHEPVATLVREAAQAAGEDEKLCSWFTFAIDKLSERMSDFIKDKGNVYLVETAWGHITALVKLRNGSNNDIFTTSEDDSQIAEIGTMLQLEHYKMLFETRERIEAAQQSARESLGAVTVPQVTQRFYYNNPGFNRMLLYQHLDSIRAANNAREQATAPASSKNTSAILRMLSRGTPKLDRQ